MTSVGASRGGAGHLTRAERTLDAQLADLAARQHLVFGLAQLVALGLGASVVRRRAASGRLHRVHRGVYSLVPPNVLSVEGRYLAAVLACGPAAALSHRSAADLHGLRACHRRTVEVIIPGRCTHRHPGIQVHRSVHIDLGADTTVQDAIPVTTVARTHLDLAAVVAPRGVERACDQAEALRVFDLRALRDQIERNPGHPGAAVLRSILATHAAGATVTDSPLEEAMYAVIAARGVPMPEHHGPIDPGDGGVIIRPDFVWRARRLVVEVDGAGTHLTRHAFEADRRRDQRLTAAGWRVIRVTWRQLHDEPARVAALLGGLLAGDAP